MKSHMTGNELRHETDALIARAELLYPAGPRREDKAMKAVEYLTAARELLREAGSVRTLPRITHALSSAKGAVRAAHYRDQREYNEQRRAEEATDREFVLVERQG